MSFAHGELWPLLLVWAVLGCLLFFAFFKGKKIGFAISPKSLTPLKNLFLWLSLGALIIAWMGPRGNPHYSQEEIKLDKKMRQLEQKSVDLVILLDVSASMGTPDTMTREPRLKRALDSIDELIKNLDGAYLTLYIFSSELSKKIPRTFDDLFFRLLAREIAINDNGVPGTDFEKVLQALAKENFGPEKTYLLVSDGDDTLLESLSGSEKENRIAAIKKAFPHPFVVLGLGSTMGGEVPQITYKGKPVISKMNVDLLKQLGELYELEKTTPTEFASAISQQARFNRQALTTPDKNLIYDEYFQWPLALSLILMILGLFLPKSLVRVSLLLLVIQLQADPALDLYEADQFAEARDAYLGFTPTSDWQKGVQKLNVTLTFLGESQVDRAALNLFSINPDPKTNPYFLKAYYEAKARLWAKVAEEAHPPYFLRLALVDANKSIDAHCDLKKWQSFPECPPDYDLEQLKIALKDQYQTYFASQNLPSFSARLWLKRIKEGTYSAYIGDEAVKKWNLTSLQEAYRNLEQKDPEEGLKFLEEGLKQIPEGDPFDDPYLTDLNKKLNPSKFKNPLELIESAIKGGYISAAQNEIDPKSLSDNQKSLLAIFEPFYAVSYQYQVQNFLKTGCEKINWGKVYPLFNQATMIAADEKLGTLGLFQMIIYLKEILKIMKEPFKKPNQEESMNQTVQSLQDMMRQDESVKPQIINGSSVERPW